MDRIHLLPKKLTHSMCQVSLVVKYTLRAWPMHRAKSKVSKKGCKDQESIQKAK